MAYKVPLHIASVTLFMSMTAQAESLPITPSIIEVITSEVPANEMDFVREENANTSPSQPPSASTSTAKREVTGEKGSAIYNPFSSDKLDYAQRTKRGEITRNSGGKVHNFATASTPARRGVKALAVLGFLAALTLVFLWLRRAHPTGGKTHSS